MTFPDLSSPSAPLFFWILGSVLVYGLAANALWLDRRFALFPALTAGAGKAAWVRWLWQAGRFLFYLGIPYLAMGGWPRRPLQGLLLPADMGLAGLDASWPVTRWLDAVGTGLGLGSVALLLLLLAWWNANRQSTQVGLRLRFPFRPWWALLIDSLYLEVHWAFYRAAVAILLGDLYAGVFVGLGLVIVEWTQSPFWRRGWRLESSAAGRWLRAALAVLSAILFLSTRNLWVCLGVHSLIELVCWQVGREQTTEP